MSAFCRLTTRILSITSRFVISHTKPVRPIAVLVPKLIAMPTSLKPCISAVFIQIDWPREPTLRIKQRVANCHTAEVLSIRMFTCLAPCPNGTIDLGRGWWDPYHVWCGPATYWHYCFYRATQLFYSAVLGVVILSVCVSVRPSVCHTRASWLIQRTYLWYFYTT